MAYQNGNEFVHLPGIVESAESSPNAAREAALRIRKLLSDPVRTPSNVQYNAIMLIRILIDNPGHTFSRNLDAKFVATVKDLLRQGKDANVHNFLRETLDALEMQRSWDEDLKLLLGMWSKEKGKTSIRTTHSPGLTQPLVQPYRQTPNYFNVPNHNGSLPSPEELSARISEAKTSAKLLIQFVQSTPPAEMLENELIKEFSDRCRTASRAVQNYIHSTNPTPDEDTLVTLIETNDELSVALSKHQHALLQARRTQGQPGSQSPASSSQVSASGSVQPAPPLPPAPPVPPRDTQSPLSSGSSTAPTVPRTYSNGAGRYEYRSEDFQVQNPFADTSGTATPLLHGENSRGEGSSTDWWPEGQQQQQPRPVQHF
ncbi:GAT-like domain-containing protein [Aspergillus ibericus CBS 121593]|uniref:GAT-like domain-containing protein n=1 Tax=Aspergillus ibericus CBS 121593 TaxID=1448316 RepID=A0A395HCR8_9EURO|nr:GAT-like domain-containing protein [Aspergillus ibericus CBS 121593]RAL05313.1 GAT-like domain-containing protein [Aspergillus ibericus CBS 121593]